MSKSLMDLARIALVLSLAGVVLASCGRKGDLDRPSTPVEQQNVRKSDSEKRRDNTVQDRPFLLDPLL